MTEGLKFVKYALLQQEPDPLEFCVCPLPLPSNIGIPLFPCELPNNFTLFQSNENHSQIGMVYNLLKQKIMDIEEEESYRIQRALCCPSSRPFNITSRDFYNNIPISGDRNFTIPFIQQPQITVKYEGIYAGRVVQEKHCEFLRGTFHSLNIYDANDILIYEIVASLKQKGLLCFMPFQSCSRITYKIVDKRCDDEDGISVNSVVGNVQHIFYGWNNEYCSKADQYGIVFPDEATEKEKSLIVMAVLFIDYLWFENF